LAEVCTVPVLLVNNMWSSVSNSRMPTPCTKYELTSYWQHKLMVRLSNGNLYSTTEISLGYHIRRRYEKLYFCATKNWQLGSLIYCTELKNKPECGPMPNVMAALPNIGGALCSTPQRVSCSNAAKTQKPLKLAGVVQTRQQISAISGAKFTILWGHEEEILLFNKFVFDCRYMPWLRRYSPTKLCDGLQMTIFA